MARPQCLNTPKSQRDSAFFSLLVKATHSVGKPFPAPPWCSLLGVLPWRNPQPKGLTGEEVTMPE